MKGLSVKEPYASLIADGLKPIETRTWWDRYRGPLLICASAKPAIRLAGYAIAIVNVVDWRRMQPADKPLAHCDYDPRLYSVVLDNLWRLPRPLRAKGALYLWDVDNVLITGWTRFYEDQFLRGCFRCPFADHERFGISGVCQLGVNRAVQTYAVTDAACMKKGKSGDEISTRNQKTKPANA
jgi:hypothetical protein